MFRSNRIDKATNGNSRTCRARRKDSLLKATRRRSFEQLEDRQMLSIYGDAVMAVFAGEVTQPNQA